MTTDAIDPEERAKEIFLYAEQFKRAAESLASKGRNKAKQAGDLSVTLMDAAPLLVLDSFATELYLKSLHWIEHGVGPKKYIHDFSALFELLSSETKESIRTWYNTARDDQFLALRELHEKRHPGFDYGLDNCLRLASNTFTTVRYGFEGINGELFYWPPLRVGIRNVIASSAPGWSWIERK